MNPTWYVTFEVPTDGTLSRRRHPRLTKTFATEAEAKDFARTKVNDGLIVTAGTIIPHLPRVSIPSVEILAWLRSRIMKPRAVLLIACTGIAMLVAGCLPVSAATRNILLLFDERVELPGLSLLDAELVRTLRSNSTEPIEVYREAMDLSRFSSNSYKTFLRDFLRAKYADKKIDVAVAVMAPAFDFLLAYGDLIFPGTPIVFCGLDRKQVGTRTLPPNVSTCST
jgi:hypothetical protein